MPALTQDRGTPERLKKDFSDPVAAAVKIFAGGIVMLDAAGNATPGATALNLKPRGMAKEQVDNAGGAAGDLNVSSAKGTYRFANDGSVTRADIDGTAYVVDDQTVADNNGGNTRSALGKIVDVDSAGVWVTIE